MLLSRRGDPVDDPREAALGGVVVLFDLMADEGHRITAYVVPDTGGTIPSVRVRGNGADLLTLPANVTIHEFVKAGRHATGTCGFELDDRIIPGIAAYQDLEILEAETDLLIYRRPTAGIIPDLNLFRLETHLLPLWRIDDALKHRFQYWYKAVDRFGRETSTQVFCLRNGASSYVSGRLLYKNYEFYLSKGIKTIAMIRDPFDELAERLIMLKKIGPHAEDLLGARDAVTFEPVIEALADYDRLDETFCKRFFRRAGELEFLALANPLVRQLTATLPQEMANHASMAAALDALSSFEIIGLRSQGAEFVAAVAEMLGLAEGSLPALSEEFPGVSELGERLRGVVAVESFLEKDLELIHHLTSAFTTAGG